MHPRMKASLIVVQAHSYERDGNDEEAFRFFYRHASLVMNKLAKHPDIKDPPMQTAWKKARADVNSNLSTMEDLKPRIKKRYEEYVEMMATRKAEQEKWQQEHRKETYSALVGGVENMSLDSSRSGYGYNQTTQLDPAKNVDLALQLAHKELRGNRQWRTSRQVSTQPAMRTAEERKTRNGRGQSFLYDESDDELTNSMMAISQRQHELTSASSQSPRQARPNGLRNQSGSAPQYPSIPKQTNRQESSWYKTSPNDSPSSITRSPELASLPPTLARPPKEYFNGSGPPPVPRKLQSASPPSGDLEVPNSLNSRDYSFKTTSTTESGAPLRTVFINPNLRARFLTIALANTERNLETCGILCGELISNAFFISKLVIPEQESTSDTCDTINEGALFDYCDSENLMTLGWIHTHPTQTCFMSSRDLHTHGGYQVQLPESVAIVCAPRHSPS